MSTSLRPIGTEFDDVQEFTDRRLIIHKRVIGYYEPLDGSAPFELTTEIGRETVKKPLSRPSETKRITG